MTKALLRYGFVLLVLTLGALPALAQEINQPLPDIPPGQELTITYQARINDELPPNVTTVLNQGTITGENFVTTLTNDPATSAAGDPTVTQLTFNLDIQALPETGESPWWRSPLLVFAAMGAMASLWFAWRSARKGYVGG